MFGRRKKAKVEGIECPLCQLVNPEGSDNCTRCYYEFNVSASQQVVSQVSDDETASLLDAFAEDNDSFDEDAPVVDWTAHRFSMDDMTVEVSDYGEDGAVAVDSHVSMDAQFEAPQQVAKVAEKVEEEVYELTAADAPEHFEKFDTGTGPDLSVQTPERSGPVVKLVEVTESEQADPVSSAGALSSEPKEEPQPVSTPVAPVVPATPVVPAAPAAPAVPAAPVAPVAPVPVPVPAAAPTAAPTVAPTVAPPAAAFAAPSDDEFDLDEEVPPAPAAPPIGIWPWPQADPWPDAHLRKALRESMELAKAGNLDAARQGLESFGPHLGERIDLIFHIGVLLKRFGRTAEMRQMIETARTRHPQDPNVATAVQHLLK